MTNRHIVDRALPERAKLMFYFPVPTQGSDFYVIELPFFENVSIKENKKAKYQKYSLISRSSNLYSYLGADSRNLTLSFNMTLPHILDEHPGVTLDQYVKYEKDPMNVDAEKEKFLNPYKTDSAPKGMAFELGTKYTKELAVESAKQVLNSDWASSGMTVEEREEFIQSYGLDPATLESPLVDNRTVVKFDSPTPGSPEAQVAAVKILDDNQQKQLKYRIIDMIIYWTNIVRSSVVNNSKNPLYGPPIIRLRHGILYQDIPCICTNYSIDYNESAGYDMDTLLPRQLKITMKLDEIRTGDFGEFDTADIIKKDNLAGWEAVVLGDMHSMDPGYGTTTAAGTHTGLGS